MAYVMKASEFVNKLKDIATNYKTLYVMGCFGAPMNTKNKTRYCDNHSYNRKAARQALIKAASSDTFGFDCVCLIKGVLWGWTGDKSKTYGGAAYKTNGVPDVSADGMIKLCSNVTTDFSKIEIGEAVWMTGHIGIYIGNGLAVECTPKWDNKVQITACNCTKTGYNTRNWTKHGKLPYIEYDVKETVITKPIATTVQSIIWNYLYERIGNPYGVAGLMGNLRAESALDADNVQNSFERKTGFTDETYTAAIDNGSYTCVQFATDKAGYGLAQWTSSGRKTNMYNHMKGKGLSIGDLMGQLEFLFVELNGSYKSVLKALKNATSVREASDVVVLKYERPARKDDPGVQAARAEFGQDYYDMFVINTVAPEINVTVDISKITKTLKRGSKGDDVREMQKALISLGYSVGDKGADGSFGKDTLAGVKVFQKDYELKVTGIFDLASIEALKKAFGYPTVEVKPETKPTTSTSKKVEAAQKFDRSIAGSYKITASSLHIRTGAGTKKVSLGTLKKDTMVKNYGYYSVADDGKNWLYVQTDKGVAGFCSSKYLKKC